MSIEKAIEKYKEYFNHKIETFGADSKGVDYNGSEAQEKRFEQLAKIIHSNQPFTILDYGCGYGAMYNFIKQKNYIDFTYFGFDMLEKMIKAAIDSHANINDAHFTFEASELVPCDYLVAGAIFNNRFEASEEEWISYVTDVLRTMDKLCTKGFSFNMLTKYSDPDRMAKRPDLFFGDPNYFFEFCKNNFSSDILILDDYGLYDFTILVRKSPTN